MQSVTATEKVENTPGAALRRLRKKNGWTLAYMAEQTGYNISALSKMETGKLALTYDKLVRISKGLGIDIVTLFSPEDAADAQAVTGRRSITRAGEGRAIDTQNYFHLYPASDLLKKRLVPIVAEIRARSLEEFGDMVKHPGEEYTYVLEGAIELHTEMYAPTRLEAGDSVYFDSGMAHAYIAAAPGPCRVLSVCTGDADRIIEATGGKDVTL